MRYWIYKDSQILGPLEREELLEKEALQPDSLVCPENSDGSQQADWVNVSDVPELAGFLEGSAAPARTAAAPVAAVRKVYEAEEPRDTGSDAKYVAALEQTIRDLGVKLTKYEQQQNDILDRLGQKESVIADYEARQREILAELNGNARLLEEKEKLMEDMRRQMQATSAGAANPPTASAPSGYEELQSKLLSYEEQQKRMLDLLERQNQGGGSAELLEGLRSEMRKTFGEMTAVYEEKQRELAERLEASSKQASAREEQLQAELRRIADAPPPEMPKEQLDGLERRMEQLHAELRRVAAASTQPSQASQEQIQGLERKLAEQDSARQELLQKIERQRQEFQREIEQRARLLEDQARQIADLKVRPPEVPPETAEQLEALKREVARYEDECKELGRRLEEKNRAADEERHNADQLREELARALTPVPAAEPSPSETSVPQVAELSAAPAGENAPGPAEPRPEDMTQKIDLGLIFSQKKEFPYEPASPKGAEEKQDVQLESPLEQMARASEGKSPEPEISSPSSLADTTTLPMTGKLFIPPTPTASASRAPGGEYAPVPAPLSEAPSPETIPIEERTQPFAPLSSPETASAQMPASAPAPMPEVPKPSVYIPPDIPRTMVYSDPGQASVPPPDLGSAQARPPTTSPWQTSDETPETAPLQPIFRTGAERVPTFTPMPKTNKRLSDEDDEDGSRKKRILLIVAGAVGLGSAVLLYAWVLMHPSKAQFSPIDAAPSEGAVSLDPTPRPISAVGAPQPSSAGDEHGPVVAQGAVTFSPEPRGRDYIADQSEEAKTFVKNYPLGGGRHDIGHWLEYSFSAPGMQPEWTATSEIGGYIVQFEVRTGLLRVKDESTIYLFEVDLARKSLRGMNPRAKELLSSQGANVRKSKKAAVSKARRAVPR